MTENFSVIVRKELKKKAECVITRFTGLLVWFLNVYWHGTSE